MAAKRTHNRKFCRDDFDGWVTPKDIRPGRTIWGMHGGGVWLENGDAVILAYLGYFWCNEPGEDPSEHHQAMALADNGKPWVVHVDPTSAWHYHKEVSE